MVTNTTKDPGAVCINMSNDPIVSILFVKNRIVFRDMLEAKLYQKKRNICAKRW